MKSLTKLILSLIAGIALCQTETNAAIIVDAGEISGLGGSGAVDSGSTLQATYGVSQTDGIIHTLLDLTSVKNVDAITIVNRSVTTNFAARTLSIWTAPDETAPGFDPSLLASYTNNVFADSLLSPSSRDADVEQIADISNVSKRYLLIEFTSSFWTGSNPFSTASNMGAVQFANIKADIIPEPSSLLIFGLGGGVLALRYRRQK
ncbi:MAG: PEP-CTERM sorting domain-containing protein [Chthoniobacterales bacterium]